MTIKFNWRRRDNGEELTKIRVEFTLSRADLAGLLIVNVHPNSVDELTEMTACKIEEAIREQLTVDADRRYWWRDGYSEGEPTADEAEEWATRQVGKL